MRRLILLLFPIIIFGYQWSTPQLVGEGETSYLALDIYDQLKCVFVRPYGGLTGDLLCATYMDSQWSSPALIRPNADICGDITTDSNRKIWMLTTDGSGAVINYYDGNIWSDTFNTADGNNHHLASDSSGKVFDVFDWLGNIWCDIGDDTIWTGHYLVCDLPSGIDAWVPRITISPDSIRWVGAIAVSPGMYQIFLCHSDSTGTWSDSIINGPQTPYGSCFFWDIASDRTGNIWIAWSTQHNNGYDTLYTSYLDNSLIWSTYYRIVYSMRLYWECCHFCVDSENKIWIVYDKSDTLCCRVWNGINWEQEDIIISGIQYLRDVFYDPTTERIWVAYTVGPGYPDSIYTTWTSALSMITENNKQPDVSIF